MKKFFNKLVIIVLAYSAFAQQATIFAAAVALEKKSEKKIESAQAKEFKDAIVESRAEKVDVSDSTQVICIFLDDSEEGMDAVSAQLTKAIEQKACPILCSATLLRHVLTGRYVIEEEEKKLAESERFCTAITGILQESLPRLEQSEHYKKVSDVAVRWSAIGDAKLSSRLSLCLFQPSLKYEDWIIRKPDPALYLLIPRAYIKANSKQYMPVSTRLTWAQPLTEIELMLGLKLDHMEIVLEKNIEPKALLSEVFVEPEYADYFNHALWDSMNERSDIFVTRSDLRNAFNAKRAARVNQWVLYLNGHGLIGDAIVGLSRDGFKQLLNFLDTKIFTRLFVYRSCFAAGYNAEQMYHDLERPLASKAYYFPIVTAALTDAPTSMVLFRALDLIIDPVEKIMKIPILLDFKGFVKSVSRNEIDFAAAVAHIIPQHNKTELIQNIPQIRLPGLPWFSLFSIEKRIVSLGTILAKTREQPLDIGRFFKRDPIGILLYDRFIPFEMIINTPPDKKNPLVIVAMDPRYTETAILKISSQTRTIRDLIYSFARLDRPGLTRHFIIGEIQGKPDGINCFHDKQQEEFASIENVIIDIPANALLPVGEEYSTQVYFSCHKKIYKGEFDYADAITDKFLLVTEVDFRDSSYNRLQELLKLLPGATIEGHIGRQISNIEQIKNIKRVHQRQRKLSKELKVAKNGNGEKVVVKQKSHEKQKA